MSAEATAAKPARKPRAPRDPNAPARVPKPKPSPEEVRRKDLMKTARANKTRIMARFAGMKTADNSALLDMATYNLTGDPPRGDPAQLLPVGLAAAAPEAVPSA